MTSTLEAADIIGETYFSSELGKNVVTIGPVAEVKQTSGRDYALVRVKFATIWCVIGEEPGYVEIDRNPDDILVAVSDS